MTKTDYEKFSDASPENAALLDAEGRVLAVEETCAELREENARLKADMAFHIGNASVFEADLKTSRRERGEARAGYYLAGALLVLDKERCRDERDKQHARALLAEAEVARLQDELTGKKAIERSKMRRYALSLRANLACPCGRVLQVMEELDAHLDHMCNDESWRSAALAAAKGGE